MSIRRTSVLGMVVLSLLAAVPAGQARVWGVGPAGPGVDFTSIGSAVAAAADGDVVLVRSSPSAPAFHLPFVIVGKSLSVLADGGPVYIGFSDDPVVVTNLGPGQSVVLRGLQVTTPLFTGASTYASLRDNLGDVRLEDCGMAVSAFSCSSVTLLRSSTIGPRGWSGVSASSSSVYAYDCVLTGSVGIDNGGSGGSGVALYGGFLFAAGTRIEGGRAGIPYCGFFPQEGDGGDGLVLGGSAPEAHLLDVELVGGSTDPCSFPHGDPGVPLLIYSGTVHDLSGFARSMEAGSPVRAGSAATIDYSGEPGDLLVTVYSFARSATFLGVLRGALLVGPPLGYVVNGPVDASGDRQFTVPFAPFPPGLDALGIELQAGAFPAGGSPLLGGATNLTVVHQDF